MPTPTERRLLQSRRAAKTGAILVPLLEEMLEHEVIPETPDDFRFMDMLVRARAIPREKGVFSPSMLGSCIRQAYFSKRGEEKHTVVNPQMNGYFLKGNFVHLQWQFALWRAHTLGLLELVTVPIGREIAILHGLHNRGVIEWSERDAWEAALNFYGNNTRPAVELRVIGAQPDFGGTIDALVRLALHEHAKVVDFKGINQIEFARQMKRGAKKAYRVQGVGYGGIVNESELPVEVDEFLLVSENKAGPTYGAGSPIALHETRVPIDLHAGEVKSRLRTLRWFDAKDELPPVECKNTRLMQFCECPFNRHCREEVLVTQRADEARAKKSPRSVKVARTR